MKLAVIFPGIGYHMDKPLLYYGKKLAMQLGYEIKEVPYGGFPKDVKGSEEKMKEAFLSALSQSERLLGEVDFTAYEELLFISKSVGTAVAAAYAGKHGLAPLHIYFTPVEQSFVCMAESVESSIAQPDGEGQADSAEQLDGGGRKDSKVQSGIVFHGTKDPWVETDIVTERCQLLKLPLYITENANHSLETGDALTDIRNLYEVMEICRRYLESDRKS